MIKAAVLLAAGRGTRLGTLTASIPKPLLPVGGSTVIDRAISGLRAAGIRRLVVVTGYRAADIESHLVGIEEPTTRFVHQDRLNGTGHALALTEEELRADGTFFVGWADVVTSSDDYRAVIEGYQPGDDGAVGVWQMDDVSAGGAVVVEDGMVRAIIEKPAASWASSRWNNAGLMVLSSEIWAEISRLSLSPRGEIELPEAVGSLARRGRIRAVALAGPWFDVGSEDGLNAARASYR